MARPYIFQVSNVTKDTPFTHYLHFHNSPTCQKSQINFSGFAILPVYHKLGFMIIFKILWSSKVKILYFRSNASLLEN